MVVLQFQYVHVLSVRLCIMLKKMALQLQQFLVRVHMHMLHGGSHKLRYQPRGSIASIIAQECTVQVHQRGAAKRHPVEEIFKEGPETLSAVVSDMNRFFVSFNAPVRTTSHDTCLMTFLYSIGTTFLDAIFNRSPM